jgi:hypothetical protein
MPKTSAKKADALKINIRKALAQKAENTAARKLIMKQATVYEPLEDDDSDSVEEVVEEDEKEELPPPSEPVQLVDKKAEREAARQKAREEREQIRKQRDGQFSSLQESLREIKERQDKIDSRLEKSTHNEAVLSGYRRAALNI